MVFSGFFYVEYARFRMKNTVESTKNKLKLEIEAWLNSDKGREALFSMGALIGNGAKTGMGLDKLTTKTLGKYGWIAELYKMYKDITHPGAVIQQ